MKWRPESVSRYRLLPLRQQKYDQQNAGLAIAPLAPLLRGP